MGDRIGQIGLGDQLGKSGAPLGSDSDRGPRPRPGWRLIMGEREWYNGSGPFADCQRPPHPIRESFTTAQTSPGISGPNTGRWNKLGGVARGLPYASVQRMCMKRLETVERRARRSVTVRMGEAPSSIPASPICPTVEPRLTTPSPCSIPSILPTICFHPCLAAPYTLAAPAPPRIFLLGGERGHRLEVERPLR